MISSHSLRISEEDRQAVEESLYLLSIPWMREAIREGLAATVDECEQDGVRLKVRF